MQLVLTMIVASFLHKLSPYFSLGRWLATARMKRYLPPSDSILRPRVASSAMSNKGKKKLTSSNPGSGDYSSLDGSLTVPKSASYKLLTTPVVASDLQLVRYSSDFQWLVDFSCASITVYLVTALYHYLRPTAIVSEYNLSVIWILATFVYAVKVLGSLTSVYFSEQLSRERSICIVFATLFLVCSLAILLVDEEILEFKLDKTYADMTRSVAKLLETQVTKTSKIIIIPKWTLKMGLAVLVSMLSALLVFPGFHFAEMHFETLVSPRSAVIKTVLHLNYISPALCLALWIRPLGRGMFADADTVSVLGMEVSYEAFRFGSLAAACFLRVLLFKVYLQSYLNQAKLRVDELKNDPGRITVSELRKKVANFFAFYSGITVQYMAPIVMVLTLIILVYVSSNHHLHSADLESRAGSEEGNVFRSSGFGIGLFHGCLSFTCWWLCFTIFLTSGFGTVLRMYL